MYEDLVAASSFTSRIRSLANEDYPIDVPKNITTRMFIVVAVNEVQFNNANGSSTEFVLAPSLNNMSWPNPSTDVVMAYYRNLSGYYTDDFPDWPLAFYNFTANDPSKDSIVAFQATKLKVLNYNEELGVVF
ncbi:hypothetical protein CDL15_Pgr017867 [Punica granatum]|uniref:Uncharacterized protein n=1 Tax=Punica granatum TaxID=22663 RepID=A0A218WGK4_PUNGR|nr:hypothetical protein CDL15_Pgr017867 [Punica granatum]PKI53132.1 hypothetical protein CRG98_026494 [Punica granatum]